MRKVLFLSLLLIAVTGLASADTVNFADLMMSTGSLTSSSSSVSVDMWSTSSNMDMISSTLNLDITGGTISLSGVFPSTAVTIGSNNCDFSSNVSCEVDFTSGPFSFDSGFFSTLMLGSPNQFTLSGSILGEDLVGTTYDVHSWTLQAVQQTPEPASILLLGSGLLVAAGSIRRKIKF